MGSEVNENISESVAELVTVNIELVRWFRSAFIFLGFLLVAIVFLLVMWFFNMTSNDFFNLVSCNAASKLPICQAGNLLPSGIFIALITTYYWCLRKVAKQYISNLRLKIHDN